MSPHRVLPVIILGGATGTAARAWLETTFAAPAGTWPWVTFWINLAGAFLLGLLLETLARTGEDHGWRRTARLGLGTGLLGGLTTYSTFAVETARLLRDTVPWVGLGYGAGSVAAGLIAAWLGFTTAQTLTVPAQHPAPTPPTRP